MTVQPEAKRRRTLLIIIGSIVGICCFCIVAVALINPTSSSLSNIPSAAPTGILAATTNPLATITPVPDSRCIPASAQQMEFIRSGIKDIQQSNDVLPGFAVRSKDFERVWFVAAEITGPDIEPKQAIGIWALGGELETPGLTLSVNGFAQQFTPYPDASKTDAQITQFSDGAQEALDCAKKS